MFDLFSFGLFPKIPRINEEPPTIFALLEMIVNFGLEDKTRIKDLASVGRTTIFDFDYPLSSNEDKEKFEVMILNHFLMRRIAFDTLTAFQIYLNVKLNEIMPTYNKMIDAIADWNLFHDGESTVRTVEDSRQIDKIVEENSNNVVEAENTTNNNSTTNTHTISDSRESELPQSEINNVRNASYLTKYNLDDVNSNGNDTSNATGTSKSDTKGTNNIKDNVSDSGTLIEKTVKETQYDRMNIYKEYLENKQNIYTMIFKDLECLFYQLV